MRPIFHLLTPPRERPLWLRTAVVVASVLAAIAIRVYLDRWLGAKSPFGVLLPAVFVSAWFGGGRAGLIATLLGSVFSAWFFIEPVTSSRFEAPADYLTTLFYLLQGAIISGLCGLLHRVLAEWRVARRQATVDFEHMADHAPGFVWSTSDDGAPRFINRRLREFVGAGAAADTLDRLARVHPADRARVREAMEAAARLRHPYQIEYRLLRADDEYRWILEHAVPRHTREGVFEGFIGAGTDVTGSRRERDELRFIGELHARLAPLQELEKTAEAVTEAVVPALADWCCIHLLGDDGRLRPTGLRHSEAGMSARAREAASPEPSTPSSAMAGLLRDGEPRLASRVDASVLASLSRDEGDREFLASLGLVSWLGVPLLAGGRVIGVLSLATAESRRVLGAENLALALKIGGIAAFALENARLYRDMRSAFAKAENERAERERSEGLFRAAWEAGIFGICVLRRDGGVAAGNDAFLRIAGHTRADLAEGRVELRSRRGDRIVRFGTFLWEHLGTSARCEPLEKICVQREGGEVPILLCGAMHPDGDSCIAFIVDMSARQAAEAEIERQRALLKTIIDAVPAMVAYLDTTERFVVHNRQCERWLGLGGRDIDGRTLREVLGEKGYAQASPHVRASLRSGQSSVEMPLQAEAGSVDLVMSYRAEAAAKGGAGLVMHAVDVTESRRLVAKVARSEKRYRTLVSASAAIVWTADADGVVRESDGWEAFTGREAGDDPTRRWMEAIHPDDRERVEGEWRRVRAESRVWDCDYRLLACDGRYHHMTSRAAAISNADGEVVEWIGTLADVTARVEAERSLRQKEAELQLIIDTMPALVAYFDKDFCYGLANRAYEKWFGYDTADLRGRKVSSVLGEEAYAVVRGPLERAMRGEQVNFEAEIPYARGGPRWINCMLTPRFDEHGRVAGCFALSIDVTVTKRNERERADLLVRYRFLADAMPQNVWTTDAGGSHDYFNRRWVEYTGLSPDSGADQRWENLVHPDDVEPTWARWREALDSGRPYQMEHRLRDAWGDYHWFLSLALPRRDAEGRVVQWVGSSTNIDAQRRAYAELAEARAGLRRHADDLEAEVRQRTARLEEVNAELQAFTSSASHDLRVPLHHIQGFAEALLDDGENALTPGGRANLQMILAATRRMDRLIIDLLAYSRLSRSEIEIADIDLAEMVEEVFAESRLTTGAAGGSLRVHGRLPRVAADRTGLRQALTNLVRNALKFVPPGTTPRVLVSAERREGGRVRLWVADNGIGIDARHHEAIFKIFHRLHANRDYEGTGIGLSLVRRAMLRMGGDCGVESATGTGSRFWLEFQPLPAAAREELAKAG